MVAVTVQLSREFQDRALAPPRRMPRLIEKLPELAVIVHHMPAKLQRGLVFRHNPLADRGNWGL